jgi:glutamyl-tRNA reductase
MCTASDIIIKVKVKEVSILHIVAVGVNYRTAPVEIREKVAFNEELKDALGTLRSTKSVLECVIVSTCNRTEIYAVVDQLHTGRYYIKTFLSNWFGLEKDSVTPYLQIWEQEPAVEHLLRVVCGLDSMILGETQILGQVRDSFLQAQEENTTGTVFNQLFKQAITVAKRSHSETQIGKNAVSVSYAAVELAKKIFGDLNKKRVLIIGAGKMGELTAKHLNCNGVHEVLVVNRTYEKANELAERFDGKAYEMDQLEYALLKSDIVISSTGSNSYVIDKQMMKSIIKERKGKPLFMVDIAVPRDISPDLDDFDSVFLYDIDDLQGIVEANITERQIEAEKIEIMIEEELIAFTSWLNTLGVVPVISALRQKALSIQAETMESIERKLPNLSEREMKVLRKHTKSIVNQLLRDPVTRVKEMAAEPNSDAALEMFKQIFALENELTSQQGQLDCQNKQIAETFKEESSTFKLAYNNN